MLVKSAKFLISNTDYNKCPAPDFPEYAFIGRSNVGKSSLINALTDNSKLAKVSGKPGKTQLINHFVINKDWYLVDLPGYGWAKVSKDAKQSFQRLIYDYIEFRTNLQVVFVLIDIRHKPQKIDLDFMQWLGEKGIPFTMIFTKADKLKKGERSTLLKYYKQKMMEVWEEMPNYFVTSSAKKEGLDNVLNYIDTLNQQQENNHN